MATPDPALLAPLVKAGYELVPLRPRGKAPRDRNWTRRPYRNGDQVAHMQDGGNVGVRLRATDLVVDVDPRNFGDVQDGVDPFSEMVLWLGLDPSDWPTIHTGGGGFHFYLTKPEGAAVVDRLPDFPGVEFKTLGRQVVAPGSVHPESDRLYTWDPLCQDPSGAPPAPATLLDAIQRLNAGASHAESGVHTADELAVMLDALDPEDHRDHGAWLELMCACHHATAGDGREEFVAWSRRDPIYSDHSDIVRRRWDSLLAEGNGARLTYRTLYKLLRDAGAEAAIPLPRAEEDFPDDLPKDALPAGATESAHAALGPASRGLHVTRTGTAPDTFANALSAVNRSILNPAYDELKQQIVFQGDLPWPASFGRRLDDNTLRLAREYLVNQFQGNDYQPSKDNVYEAVSTMAFRKKFNPVLDYLGSLEWDGVRRVERLFPDYFNTEDDDYARAVSVCFMAGAVRRQRSPGCKLDTMPVLRSTQGWNKSTGLKVLFGDEYFSDADLGDLKNKDAPLLLHGIWLQEFAELDGMRRAESNTLKAFCSRAVDRVRPPYGRVVTEMPRRCVFAGTVNEGGYLSDPTGGRRFWPLRVLEPVDVDAISRDRDQLWAEAAEMEGRGESHVLPAELWAAAAERQADETTEDPWADTIRNFLDVRAAEALDHALGLGDYAEGGIYEGEKAPPADRVLTCELFDALDIKRSQRTRGLSQRLKSMMEGELGWAHGKSIRVRGRIGAGYKAPGT